MADARLGPLVGLARPRRTALLFAGTGLMLSLGCILWWAGGKPGAHSGARAASYILMLLTGILLAISLLNRLRVYELGIEAPWSDDKVMLFAEMRAIREQRKRTKVEWVFVGPQGNMRALDQSWVMSEAVRRRIEDERARLIAGGQT